MAVWPPCSCKWVDLHELQLKYGSIKYIETIYYICRCVPQQIWAQEWPNIVMHRGPCQCMQPLMWEKHSGSIFISPCCQGMFTSGFLTRSGIVVEWLRLRQLVIGVWGSSLSSVFAVLWALVAEFEHDLVRLNFLAIITSVQRAEMLSKSLSKECESQGWWLCALAWTSVHDNIRPLLGPNLLGHTPTDVVDSFYVFYRPIL